MLRGIDYSRNGLESKARAVDVIANNLANSNTVGFKRIVVFSQSIAANKEKPQDHAIPAATLDLSQGRLRATGNPLDVAIDGDGFFTVQTDSGLFFTRGGNFKVDREGFLVTANGDYVLGDGGPIAVEDGFHITENGEIVNKDEVVDRLAIVGIRDKSQLKLAGNGLFTTAQNNILRNINESTRIRSGYLEDSNVEPLEEMVTLIETYRQFEANQKALKSQDESLGKAVNDVGRVG